MVVVTAAWQEGVFCLEDNNSSSSRGDRIIHITPGAHHRQAAGCVDLLEGQEEEEAFTQSRSVYQVITIMQEEISL